MNIPFSAGQQVLANGPIHVHMTDHSEPLLLANDGDDLVIDAVNHDGYTVRHLGESTPFQVQFHQVR